MLPGSIHRYPFLEVPQDEEHFVRWQDSLHNLTQNGHNVSKAGKGPSGAVHEQRYSSPLSVSEPMPISSLPKNFVTTVWRQIHTALVSEDVTPPFLWRYACSFFNCCIRAAGRVDGPHHTGMPLSSLFQFGVFLMALGEQIPLFHATLLLGKVFLPVSCYRLQEVMLLVSQISY